MALLGLPLLLLTGALAVLAPVLALVTWNRVRGPRVARHAQRLGLMLVSQLTALLLAGVAVNNHFDFYSSWSDLLGTSRGGAALEVGLGAAGSPFNRGLNQPAAWGASSGAKAQHLAGRLVPVQLTGPTTGLSEQALVYLPPQYQQGDRYLPVVEVLSGYPGSALAMARDLQYPFIYEQALRARLAIPMVLVLLKVGVTSPWDTECTNVPHGPQAFSFFANDVPTLIRSQLGLTSPLTAAAGVSSGAYCAAKLAMLRPDRFSGGVALSGYFVALQDYTTGDLWGGSKVLREHNDLRWRLEHLPAPRAHLFIGTSKQERGADGYGVARQFLSLVRAPMTAAAYIVPTGGHNYSTWRRIVPASIVWLSDLFLQKLGLPGEAGPHGSTAVWNGHHCATPVCRA